MKRKYEKPRIIIEDFITNDSFATGCSAVLTFSMACAATGDPELDMIMGDGLFNGKCNYEVGDDYNGYCYHTLSNPIIAS